MEQELGLGRILRGSACWRALAVCVAGLVFCVPAASAAPIQTHLFSAKLSLSGSCSESAPSKEEDTVPDPGCPGGSHPPLGAFVTPSSIAVDDYGDTYVASEGSAERTDARVDIFSATGHFLIELAVPGLQAVAVDSGGRLYTYGHLSGEPARIRRYDPTEYEPATGKIKYGPPSATVITESEGLPQSQAGIAVNSSNGHLFIPYTELGLTVGIAQFGSGAEGNPLLTVNKIGKVKKLAVDGLTGEVFASAEEGSGTKILAFNSSGTLLRTISGFKSATSLAFPASEDATGHLFVADMSPPASKNRVLEFTSGITTASESLATFVPLEHKVGSIFGSGIAVDNGSHSPNRGTVYVPSEVEGRAHLFAFEPIREEVLPKVESLSVADITQSEASFQGSINPGNGKSSYRFQITTQQSFEVNGFTGAPVLSEGEIQPSNEGQPISAIAEGLQADTSYRVRVTGENGKGAAELELSFRTYPAEQVNVSCVNQARRVMASALLPDCRAYEIVTPPDTGGHLPSGVASGVGGGGDVFATVQASSDGSKVSFLSQGGVLPGTEGTGSLNGDPYLAQRGPAGWQTKSFGPTGAETEQSSAGSVSIDQEHLFWTAAAESGPASVEGKQSQYIRYPDGTSALVGRGSLGVDPTADGVFVSENAGHVIFATGTKAVQLEPDAPPNGTPTVYDRTADGVTHVVSLLPGNATPGAGQAALFRAASVNGMGVAFSVGSSLYLRRNDSDTFLVATGGESPTPGGFTPAGVSADGSRLFYEQGGDLFAYDAASESTLEFASSGDATFVNVSSDGSRVLFVSPSVLTGAETNPSGDSAQAGGENLYVSDGANTHFVATVTKRDVEGVFSSVIGQADGLSLWALAAKKRAYSIDPSRSTPTGSVFLFSSRANLTQYDSQNQEELYRYDLGEGSLSCLSCTPTGLPPASDASLQSISLGFGVGGPVSLFGKIDNLRAGGDRAFFQTSEPLVTRDTDGIQDVYEWEAAGIGDCSRPQGCLNLVSSGHSARPNYLYAISESGDDAFFLSADLLVPADLDSTPSIYDARVNGGFPEAPSSVCQGEACRGPISPPPALTGPASPTTTESGNVSRRPKCSKHQKRVKKNGKSRCVKKHTGAKSTRKAAGK